MTLQAFSSGEIVRQWQEGNQQFWNVSFAIRYWLCDRTWNDIRSLLVSSPYSENNRNTKTVCRQLLQWAQEADKSSKYFDPFSLLENYIKENPGSSNQTYPSSLGILLRVIVAHLYNVKLENSTS